MRRILIHMDPEGDLMKPQLLFAAHALFPDDPCELYALVGSGSDVRQVCDCMARLHQAHNFDAILMADSLQGNDCAPRLAALLDAALITSVTAIRAKQGKLTIERPIYGRQAIGQFEIDPARLVILTIKAGPFDPAAPACRPTLIHLPAEQKTTPSGIGLIARQVMDKPDIRDSAILISGGRGAQRDFGALQPLADALGGAVAASRAMVDAGFAERSQQVGQTGKRVSPRLYLALGINGAIQHVAGLENAEHIISVNTNVNAPICSLSDIVVKGDAFAFIDQLLNKIKEEQCNGTL